MDRPDRTDRLGEMNVDEPGRLERVADKAREGMDKAKEGLAAAAGGVAEFTRTAATETRDRAGRVADFVTEAETDVELKATVSGATQRSVDRAADALVDSAPSIGRGVEWTAEKLGQMLHLIARPLGTVLGAIAGTAGGWWNKAAEVTFELPEAEEQACRTHFTSITYLPPELTFERARTGYSLGYVASRNPEYRGRSFEEIEPDLRHGFPGEHAPAYDALREFTRFGYTRGSSAGM